MESEVLTLKDVLDILKNKLWLIIIIMVIGTSFGVYYQKNYVKPTYLTSTKLFIGKEGDGNSPTIYDNSDVSLYQSLVDTYAGILSSRDLIDKAMENCNTDIPISYVYSALSVETGEKSQFITLSIITPDAKDGVPILEAVTNEFINSSKELISNSVIKTIAKPRIPEEPYNYSSNKMIVVCFLGSIFIGICLSIFLEFIDNTVKKKEDIDKILKAPVIGVVPLYSSDDNKKDKKKREKKKRVMNNDFNGV